jgi:hypothetical protein
MFAVSKFVKLDVAHTCGKMNVLVIQNLEFSQEASLEPQMESGPQATGMIGRDDVADVVGQDTLNMKLLLRLYRDADHGRQVDIATKREEDLKRKAPTRTQNEIDIGIVDIGRGERVYEEVLIEGGEIERLGDRMMEIQREDTPRGDGDECGDYLGVRQRTISINVDRQSQTSTNRTTHKVDRLSKSLRSAGIRCSHQGSLDENIPINHRTSITYVLTKREARIDSGEVDLHDVLHRVHEVGYVHKTGFAGLPHQHVRRSVVVHVQALPNHATDADVGQQTGRQRLLA